METGNRKMIWKKLVPEDSFKLDSPVLIIITDQQQEAWAATAKRACTWCLNYPEDPASKAMAALILWLYNPSEWPNSFGLSLLDYKRMEWARDLIEMRCAGYGPHQIFVDADIDFEEMKKAFCKHQQFQVTNS